MSFPSLSAEIAGQAPLSARDRALVSALWLGRAESEARAAIVFRSLDGDLQALGAPPILRELAGRAVGEEVDHAQICTAVASAYAGRVLDVPVPPPFTIIELVTAPPSLQPLLRVLLSCALSESCATMFLERMRANIEAPIGREATRLLLKDEIDHARIGWGLLASERVTDEMRGALGAWLPVLVRLTLRTWRRRPLLDTTRDLRGHGSLPWQEVDACIVEALRTMVLPGFEALGVDVGPATRWLHSIGAGRALAMISVGEDGQARFRAVGQAEVGR